MKGESKERSDADMSDLLDPPDDGECLLTIGHLLDDIVQFGLSIDKVANKEPTPADQLLILKLLQ